MKKASRFAALLAAVMLFGSVSQSARAFAPKHDAGTATRHYRAFWQRRCRAAAVGAVLKANNDAPNSRCDR